MITDDQLLATLPDFVRFDTMMKARPATEGDERLVYVEASTEARDQEGEVVLSKALKDSLDVFMKFGVVDLDHKSMPSVAQKYGIPQEDCPKWIVGQPVAVRFDGDKTLVKARLRQGDTPLAAQANQIWDGLTKLNPPDRYYASVGGSVLAREIRIDPTTKDRIPVITKTRWNNLALSLQPVNQHLDAASTVPIGTFAKAFGGFVLKALEAGYATDASAMTGGQALSMQSLDRGIASYFDFRERISADIRAGKVGRDVTKYAMTSYGLSADKASTWAEKFLQDITRSSAKNRRLT
jgi:hypothetical protein